MVAFLAASIGSQMLVYLNFYFPSLSILINIIFFFNYLRLVRAIPYESGKVSSKHLAWALHAGIIGAFLAPMTALGKRLGLNKKMKKN